jgi:histidine ammonia-lyase
MSNSAFPGLRTVRFSNAFVDLDDIVDIAGRKATAALSEEAPFQEIIHRGAALLERILREDGVIYGVTTGYGDSCQTPVLPELIGELPHRLMTYHGCGLGEFFTPEQTRAILAVRLTSLCKGCSGVRLGLLESIVQLLRADILPRIPSEGSVGASGDLTPLSYLAAVLCGEREVWSGDGAGNAAKALHDAGIAPLQLAPKEALALMNGTAAMTGVACLAYSRAQYLTCLTTRITSLAALALNSNAEHFDEKLFALKPHRGMQEVASRIRHDLGVSTRETVRNSERLQDRYSIRCAPHVIGVLADALPWMRSTIESELNSVNDNPVLDMEGERILHGGHFYGGHIAFAMDSMKNAVANLADLMDRQMALLVDARYNNGLPANLSGADASRVCINHGLKALQISVSAWTAEALKLTMPASVFSRSTECHNQDKVSMGTIAARDCVRVLELTEQVAAALLITVRQALSLRFSRQADLPMTPAIRSMYELLQADIDFIEEDRRLDTDLRHLLKCIRNRQWMLYR